MQNKYLNTAQKPQISEQNLCPPTITFRTKANLLPEINAIQMLDKSEYSQGESVINNYIISNLNNHTFHLSPNDKFFYYEQFESNFLQSKVIILKKYQLGNLKYKILIKNLKNKFEKPELDGLVDNFQEFLANIDQLRVKFESLIKNRIELNEKDPNNNYEINESQESHLEHLLENFFSQLFSKQNENVPSQKDKLENLIIQTRSLIGHFKSLSKQYKSQSSLLMTSTGNEKILHYLTPNCGFNSQKYISKSSEIEIKQTNLEKHVHYFSIADLNVPTHLTSKTR